MPAYYNEIDPFAGAWLKELIKEGVIADGEIDNRSIEENLQNLQVEFASNRVLQAYRGDSEGVLQAVSSRKRKHSSKQQSNG